MNKSNNLSVRQRIDRKLCGTFKRVLPDRLYLEMLYRVRLGTSPDFVHPSTFNEKLNWLKLNDRNPMYTKLADKYEVRNFVKEIIGENYLIPILGVWNSAEEIEFDKLPDQFVLKCTHDSASVVICEDKKNFDVDSARRKLSAALNTNYYYPAREWPYKNIVPRIIAEKYMSDESGKELKDYKVYDFNGVPELIQVDFGRFVKHERNLYTKDWKFINQVIEYQNNPNVVIDEPSHLKEMLMLAEELAKSIPSPSVRTDFYSCGDRIFFGEITFYQEAGFARFSSSAYEKELGDMIHLPIQQ